MDVEREKFIKSLGIFAGSGVLMFVARVFIFGDLDLWYLNWNLLLAAVPLLSSWTLVGRLKRSRWSDTPNLILTLLWLGFLPNSFYIITDFIHLLEIDQRTLLFDIVMIMFFTIAGLMMGYASVLAIHRQLRQRQPQKQANLAIGFVFVLCSFAIYLGRYMRWNTWDILVNPAGLLFDVSDSIVNPRRGSPVIMTTILFFVFITVFYLAVLQFVSLTPSTPGNKPSKKVK